MIDILTVNKGEMEWSDIVKMANNLKDDEMLTVCFSDVDNKKGDNNE